ncbi:MAG: CBS domain-containing protein [Planctomycetota bacterium]
MQVCPYCGVEVLAGVDICDECHQPLTDLSVRVPAMSVEADLMRDTVSQIPTHPPVTFSPSATVREVLAAMIDQRIGCVLVAPDDRPNQLAGIFSERDALMRLNVEAPRWLGERIDRFMTPNPATIPTDAKIAFALHKMNHGGYRHLPLMEGDRPVSVISVRDLLRYLTEHSTASE